MQLFSNNASTALASAITDNAISIGVIFGTGGMFQAPALGNYELATITDGTNSEVIKITARSADVLTVERGQDDTSARNWSAGATIEGRITKGTLENLLQNLGDGVSSLAAGPSSVATALQATAVGASAQATDQDAVALGYAATASGPQTLAMGKSASASADNAIAIGDGAASTAVRAIAVGANASAAQIQDVVVGDGALTVVTGTWQAGTVVAAGTYIVATIAESNYLFEAQTAVGTTGGSAPAWNITLGSITTDNTVTWGVVGQLYGPGTSSTALGTDAKAVGGNAVAIGRGAVALYGVATGTSSIAHEGSVAVGSFAASAQGTNHVAIGNSAKALGEYAAIAIGSGAIASGANYSVMIGADGTNDIENTHKIIGSSLIAKHEDGWEDYRDVYYTGQETYVFSETIDLKQMAADDIVAFAIPANTKFFPTEFGVIVTSASTVTVQPEISFGITGNTTSLLAQTATTKTAAGGKDVFTPISGDGVATGIKASLKVSAAATTLTGRFYIKGLLVEDQ